MLEVEQSKAATKVRKFVKIQQPNEALGLSTYTTGSTNISLKIREAWLPKFEINNSYPPLAWLPLWCIDVATCVPSFLKDNLK